MSGSTRTCRVPGARLRVGVVGAGRAGLRHLDRLVVREDAVVVAVADPSEPQRERVRRRYGVDTYPSGTDLLASVRVDAALLCVPPDQHGSVERACLDAGVPFLVEKPLGVDRVVPGEIASWLGARDVPAAVGYQWRQLSFLRDVVAELADRQVDLVVATWLGPPADAPWWGDVRSAGGQLVEQVTHLVDLAVLLNGPVELVSGTASRRRLGDLATGFARASTISARFRNGAAGAFVSTCSLAGSSRRCLELVAEDLAVTITDSSCAVTTSSGRRQWAHEPPDCYTREHDAFLELVATGSTTRPLVPYAEALAVHSTVCAMEELLVPVEGGRSPGAGTVPGGSAGPVARRTGVTRLAAPTLRRRADA